MRASTAVLLVAFLALAAVACSALEGKPGSRPRPHNSGKCIIGRNYRGWGANGLRWYRHELREAKRDLVDANNEVGTVRAWARNFVRHRVNVVKHKIANRKSECGTFRSMYRSRKANFRFHQLMHRKLLNGKLTPSRPNRVLAAYIRKYGPKKGKELYRMRFGDDYEAWRNKRKQRSTFTYRSKYSLHAHMFRVSQQRVGASRRALKRCRNVIRKLQGKLGATRVRARAVARNAVRRAKLHVVRVQKWIKAIRKNLRDLKRKICSRRRKSKKFYYHSCKRVRRHKYRCRINHASRMALRTFRFFKCFWASAKGNVSKFTCYK